MGVWISQDLNRTGTVAPVVQEKSPVPETRMGLGFDLAFREDNARNASTRFRFLLRRFGVLHFALIDLPGKSLQIPCVVCCDRKTLLLTIRRFHF
jgi:hypothetical protein